MTICELINFVLFLCVKIIIFGFCVIFRDNFSFLLIFFLSGEVGSHLVIPGSAQETKYHAGNLRLVTSKLSALILVPSLLLISKYFNCYSQDPCPFPPKIGH